MAEDRAGAAGRPMPGASVGLASSMGCSGFDGMLMAEKDVGGAMGAVAGADGGGAFATGDGCSVGTDDLGAKFCATRAINGAAISVAMAKLR
ncbi:hypothetical protein [Sphingobium lactosutens]|uniref:hypothetical protein n=1 Tax=Sphingobium lactosutens TaxID=522773 RepID=UPI0015B81E4F|nr:hypothetical protein [Sphingobium lactosutens]